MDEGEEVTNLRAKLDKEVSKLYFLATDTI